jgi:hypothetical protein
LRRSGPRIRKRCDRHFRYGTVSRRGGHGSWGPTIFGQAVHALTTCA